MLLYSGALPHRLKSSARDVTNEWQWRVAHKFVRLMVTLFTHWGGSIPLSGGRSSNVPPMNLPTLRMKHAALAATVVIGALSLGACGGGTAAPVPSTNTGASTGAAASAAATTPAAPAPGASTEAGGTTPGAAGAPSGSSATGGATDGSGSAGATGSGAAGDGSSGTPSGVNAGSGGLAAINGDSQALDLGLVLGGIALAAGAGGLLVRWRRAG